MTSEIRANTLKNRVGLGTIEYSNTGPVISGVTTSNNFKTGSTNVHSVGVEAAGINVLGADTPIGTGATIYNSGAAVFTGVVTATSFSGIVKASNLTSGRVVFTTTNGQLEASGNLSYNGTTLVSGSPVEINSDLDVDGHTNLDNVSIAGVTTGTTINATTFVGALTGTASGNPTLTSGANNRVVTATGANALTGESTLTFDGTTLSVTGAADLAGTLIFQPGGTAWSTTNTRPQLGRQADGELRLGAGSDSSSIVTFYTSPSAGGTLTEKLRILSGGGITVQQGNNHYPTTFIGGSTGGRNYLTVRAGNATSGHYSGFNIQDSSANHLWQFGVQHTTDDLDIFGNSAGGNLRFWTKKSGAASSTIKMLLAHDGNLALGGTNTSAYANQSHFFIGSTGNLYADTSSGTGKSLSLSNNAYINTSGNWVYRVGDKATNIYQYNGEIGFRLAGTGSAGNTISWSEALRIGDGLVTLKDSTGAYHKPTLKIANQYHGRYGGSLVFTAENGSGTEYTTGRIRAYGGSTDDGGQIGVGCGDFMGDGDKIRIYKDGKIAISPTGQHSSYNNSLAVTVIQNGGTNGYPGIHLKSTHGGGDEGMSFVATDDNWDLYTLSGNENGLGILRAGSASSGNARFYLTQSGHLTVGDHAYTDLATSKKGHTMMHVAGGGLSIGPKGNSSTTTAGGRYVLGWYMTGYSSSHTYLHLITDLWAGGSPHGNSEYIMGGFHIHGHQYAGGASVGRERIYFHNWSGSYPGYSNSNPGTWTPGNTVYTHSTGYVALRLLTGSYRGYIIDLIQHSWYGVRDMNVTSATYSDSSTL